MDYDSSADDAVDTVQTEPRVLHLHHRHALAAHFYTRATRVIYTVGGKHVCQSFALVVLAV